LYSNINLFYIFNFRVISRNFPWEIKLGDFGSIKKSDQGFHEYSYHKFLVTQHIEVVQSWTEALSTRIKLS